LAGRETLRARWRLSNLLRRGACGKRTELPVQPLQFIIPSGEQRLQLVALAEQLLQPTGALLAFALQLLDPLDEAGGFPRHSFEADCERCNSAVVRRRGSWDGRPVCLDSPARPGAGCGVRRCGHVPIQSRARVQTGAVPDRTVAT
jgi:hypothetical protein